MMGNYHVRFGGKFGPAVQAPIPASLRSPMGTPKAGRIGFSLEVRGGPSPSATRLALGSTRKAWIHRNSPHLRGVQEASIRALRACALVRPLPEFSFP